VNLAEMLAVDPKVYAGIGSRETPTAVLTVLEALAAVLARAGLVLRSGGAPGADAAFEAGADRASGVKEIYLPWKKFNGNESERFTVPKEAFALAEEYHPLGAGLRANQASHKLIARNCQQILGQKLDSPVAFVVCWTAGGGLVGGTAQALRIAVERGIRVANLGDVATLREISSELALAREVERSRRGLGDVSLQLAPDGFGRASRSLGPDL
jgi:hypothetical protein